MAGYKIKNPSILSNARYIAAVAANEITGHVMLDYEAMIRVRAKEKFETLGGCKSCRGRGWRVTWDTLDSMTGCYAEYGPCENDKCTPATRAASGMLPANNKYDGLRNTTWELEDELEEAEKDWYAMIKHNAATAKAQLGNLTRELIQASKPAKGMKCRVTSSSGRKVGKHDKNSQFKGRVENGSEGIITWVGRDLYSGSRSSAFGTTHFGTWEGRCCIALTDRKFENGRYIDIAWIDAKHLEIIS